MKYKIELYTPVGTLVGVCGDPSTCRVVSHVIFY